MEKLKIQKSRVSDIFFVKQKFIQFLNRGMSKLPYSRRSMGKDNFQALLYLTDLELNPQISIRWRYSVECHIISRVWGLQKITSISPISWKIYRDTHIYATHECGEIFPVNPYNSQNIGEVNSHGKEKICENTNIRILRVS